MLGRFLQGRSGNIAVLWALALLPMAILIAGVVDFNRRQNYETRLQSAVDSATLAADRYTASTDAKEVKDHARDLFLSRETYIELGIIWGVRLLSSDAPLS